MAFLCFVSGAVFAQADIHFSQFYETTILRNPALVGVFSGNYKISVYDRSQWNTVANPYQTVLANAEYRISLSQTSYDFLSLGLLGFYDQAGDIDQKISACYPALNFNKSLNQDKNSYLSFGFTAGALQYSFDPTKATFNNQFVGGVFSALNPTFEHLPNPKRSLVDLGAGVNFNSGGGDGGTTTVMIGASGYHLTEPVFAYTTTGAPTESTRWNMNAGLITEISNNAVFQLHANGAAQGTYRELVAGGLIGWRTYEGLDDPSFEIYGGLFYRAGDAVIPVVKMRYKNLAIGVSYDVNVSTLKPASNMQGGYEVTLSLSGNYPKSAGYKKTVCPRF